MRFDSAREAGLDEAKAALIEDDFLDQLDPKVLAAIGLTDALIGLPSELPVELQVQLKEHFSEAQLVEMTLGVGLFLGMSKVLISLGLEPQEMPVTVMPTPGS